MSPPLSVFSVNGGRGGLFLIFSDKAGRRGLDPLCLAEIIWEQPLILMRVEELLDSGHLVPFLQKDLVFLSCGIVQCVDLLIFVRKTI